MNDLDKTKEELIEELQSTRQKLAQLEKASKPDELYRTISELISDYAYVLRLQPNGWLIREWVSEALNRITGYTPEELDALNGWVNLAHPDDQDIVEEHRNAFKSGKEDVREYRIITKGGEIRWLRDYARPFWDDEEERVVLIVGAAQDITEQKRAEGKLKAAFSKLEDLNASKDKFFSIIAHDLRNPFVSILRGIETMKDGQKEVDRELPKVIVNDVYNPLKNLYRLIENLLTWSKLQVGTIKYNPKKLDLSFAVIHQFGLLKQRALKKNISLLSSVNDDLCVYADSQMIDMVIRNLVDNAIKFTPSGGRVEILAAELENFIEISVLDTGIGIDEQHLKQLFHIDSKYQNEGTEGEKGSGLGLILCRDFIEKNGGEIFVESHLNSGSIFKFTLPKSREA